MKRFAPLAAALVVLAAFAFASPPRASAQGVKIDSETFAGLEPRAIGPAVMSGRIACLDAVQEEKLTIWVGAASGGVWKSMDGGTSFKPVFDKYIQSIGDLRIDPQNSKTVWVGTGEPWVRNSTSIGEGVFRTTNGGDDWEKLGLEKTERIAKICIDPKNSDRVFVAALGALWGPSADRGVYRTLDGGKSWEKVLFVDDNTGAADLAMDPSDPNTLYASMWQFRRTGWSFVSGGPGSAFFKTTDGGKTWTKLTKDLPAGTLGRIAVEISPAMPNRVYAVVEAKESALYRSDDKGASWTKMSTSFNLVGRPFYFARFVCHPTDPNKAYKPGFGLSMTEDGGGTWAGIAGSPHGDHHATWINPKRPAQILVGTDGGLYISEDNGMAFRFVGQLPLGQFYHVSVDSRFPYHVYGGLQDNGTWTGPSHNSSGIGLTHWKNIGFGDGFAAFVEPSDEDYVYSEMQGGIVWRRNLTTGEQKTIKPFERIGDPKLRFNWNTPLHVGEKSRAFYQGSQFLYRTRDRGEHWERLGGDLTTNDPVKQQQELSGGVSVDNSSAENHCTIYTICESPLNADLIWVGTDDGNLQITRDGGKSWTNVAKNITGLPANSWVSCVDASRFAEGTAYATFDRHTMSDMKTYVYKTVDFGKTWTSLATPELKWFAHVIKQDRVNPSLLFLGTEYGLYVSLDDGKQWGQLTPGLPNVPVRDLAIHPREGDLVIATHGRALYVLDDLSPLRSLDPATLDKDVAFLPARPAVVYIPNAEQRFDSEENFVGRGYHESASINYYLKKRHMIGDLKVEVYDAQGKLIQSINGGKRRGINRVTWSMRMKPPKSPPAAQLIRDQGAFMGPRVPFGDYSVKLIKGKETLESKLTLAGDPRSKYSTEDRAIQNRTVMQLYGMLADLTYLTEVVIDVRKQAGERLAKLGPKDPARKALQPWLDRVDAFRNSMSATREGAITGEEQLREKLGLLYGAVNFHDGRPTGAQIDNLKLMEQELAAAQAKQRALTEKELLSVNATLVKSKLEPIAALSREVWEKKD
ncbi:MAG: glycosyl hydrolase [Candidatus Eisenbacteria bacterium]|uniref:Glycosyl hydrolase n=1 Tax=Eiseniibacteriota bacterium TaxID=2212470 RepID=A0A849SML1_UNCEI|nr:glycosyl hydrolase [Candidatus Eisenbacteria bacterium]